MSSKLLTIEESKICSDFTVDIIKLILANVFECKVDDFDIKFKINKKNNLHIMSFIKPELKFSDVNVYNFDGEKILLTKLINDIDITKLDIFPLMPFYKENYKKIVALFSTYFENVDIVLFADCSFSRYIGKSSFISLNKDFKPDFKINNYEIRIVGNNSLYKKNIISRYTESVNSIIFKNQKSDYFIKKIFNYYNNFVINSEYGVELNNEQTLEELESNLNLIKILMI